MGRNSASRGTRQAPLRCVHPPQHRQPQRRAEHEDAGRDDDRRRRLGLRACRSAARRSARCCPPGSGGHHHHHRQRQAASPKPQCATASTSAGSTSSLSSAMRSAPRGLPLQRRSRPATGRSAPGTAAPPRCPAAAAPRRRTAGSPRPARFQASPASTGSTTGWITVLRTVLRSVASSRVPRERRACRAPGRVRPAPSASDSNISACRLTSDQVDAPGRPRRTAPPPSGCPPARCCRRSR